MRRIGITVLMAGLGLATIAATAQPADTAVAAVSWDLARMGRTIAAARQARQAGDLDSAERLCRVAFESVDRSALAAYGAYADRIKARHRNDEAAVRERFARLRALKAEQSSGTQPTGTYLGFAPAEGLNAYADLLSSVREVEESQRMHSLALCLPTGAAGALPADQDVPPVPGPARVVLIRPGRARLSCRS